MPVFQLPFPTTRAEWIAWAAEYTDVALLSADPPHRRGQDMTSAEKNAFNNLVRVVLHVQCD